MINDKSKLTDVTQIDTNPGDKRKVFGNELRNAPQQALTAQSGTPTGTDAGTISNTITRVGEIEARLKNLGLLL